MIAVLMVIPGIAMAAWKADRTGSGAAQAATMPAGNQPSVTANGRDLTITWSASQLNTTPATNITGGYIVARLAPDRPVRHALVLGIIGFVLSIAGVVATWNRGPEFGPRWYPLALAAIALPCAWAGGKIREKQLRKDFD